MGKMNHLSSVQEAGECAAATTAAPRPSFVWAIEVLADHRRQILYTIGVSLLIGIVTGFLVPPIYVAETKILPPEQRQSMAALLLGQLGPFGSLAGKDLLKDKSELYVGMLKSSSVEEALVDRYNLQAIYKVKTRTEARIELERASEIVLGKNQMISVKVEDADPIRAALLANGYVSELRQVSQRLNSIEAGTRLKFFEDELREAKRQLTDAEIGFKQTQEKTGLIQLDSQSKAIIDFVASFRAQIAAREVRLRAMRTYATDRNPDVVQLEQEIAGAREQLRRMEQNQTSGEPSIMVATGKVPSVGLEYVRKYRDVKYFEAVYELMSKQYEAARIDQAQSFPLIQVVDPAVPPERPKAGRSLLALFFTVTGTLGALAFFLLRAHWEVLSANPESARLQGALRALFSRSRG